MKAAVPDHTAVRVALWRALHVEIDTSPHILEDTIGLKLVAPEAGWQQRGDMHPQGTRGYRASIVGRARFIEDLLVEQMQKGLDQYVILGAGLDTLAQRRPELGAKLRIFEVEQPETQAWKRQRLLECGYSIPPYLKLVPVNFESGESWKQKLGASGFDARKPALLASTGVSMYLTREANLATLREIASMAPGSMVAMTFMLPTQMVPPDEQAAYAAVQERTKASGTPFLSLFNPEEMLALAREAGFQNVQHVSGDEITRHYFAGREDGLKPASGEEFLIARV